MNTLTYIKHFECTTCSKKYPTQGNPTYCKACQAPLLARYDLDQLCEKLDKGVIMNRPRSGIWRWRELLPLEDLAYKVTLGEGETPLLHLSAIGSKLGFKKLYLKEEGRNPSGSFKARGFSVAVSKALENNQKKLILPSAGNAGGALAAYTARANLRAKIILPKNTLPSIIAECKAAGADVILVDGSIAECGKLAEEIATTEGWHVLSTFKEPYRLEGKKTIGFELAFQLDWEPPQVVIFPTGGGTGLVGIWKAYSELSELGWLTNGRLPRMVAVQSSGCAPLVKAFFDGADVSEPWPDPHTIASGLQVPISFASRLILKIIRDTSGCCVAVTDADIVTAQRYLARFEGISVSPEGAASLAGASHLLENDLLQPDETIVIFNTASAVKYLCRSI